MCGATWNVRLVYVTGRLPVLIDQIGAIGNEPAVGDGHDQTAICETRSEFSKLHDALIQVRAKNDFGWISIAFTVNYVVLGIILWRLFG